METSCWRWRERGRRGWRWSFCLICINVKVITMQGRNVFIVLSHASLPECQSPTTPTPIHGLWGERKKDSSVSVATPWLASWMDIQSFIRSLAAYTPIEHEDVGHSGPQTATEHRASRQGPWARAQPQDLSSKDRVGDTSWRTQVRLSTLDCTSFEDKPKISGSQIKASGPPRFRPGDKLVSLNIFGALEILSSAWPQLCDKYPSSSLPVRADDLQTLRWTEAITVSEMDADCVRWLLPAKTAAKDALSTPQRLTSAHLQGVAKRRAVKQIRWRLRCHPANPHRLPNTLNFLNF